MNGCGGNCGRARRRRAGVVVGAGALVVVGALAMACSAKHDAAPGEILLAIDTNLRVSGDVDTIGLSVSLGDGTHVTEDAMFPLAPVGNAMFPATLAIVRGTTQPIKIRVVGYQQNNPISLRDTITTIPADRTALLRMDIDWLDQGSVMTTAGATTVSSLMSTLCPDGQTSIGGGCSSYTLDSATLGTFDPSNDLVASNGPQCFDVLSCFASTSVMTVPRPSASDCTLDVPATATGDNLNIGLNVPPGHGGWCSTTGCVVPVEMNLIEGWSLNSEGRLQLPPGACTNPLVESIAVLVNDCDTYTPAHPACEMYGDAGTTTKPVGDATVPPDGAISDASGDATMTLPDGAPLPDGGPLPDAAVDAAVDSGPPDMPYTYTTTSSPISFAVSATRLYVLTGNFETGASYLQTFPRGQPGNGTAQAAVTYNQPQAGAVMTASGALVAIADIMEDTKSTGVLMFDVGSDGTLSNVGPVTVNNVNSNVPIVGIEDLPAGGERAFSANLSTTYKFCWRDVGGTQACTTSTDGDFFAAAVDPATGTYVLAKRALSFTGAQSEPLVTASFNPTNIDGGAFTTTTTLLPSIPAGTIEGLGFGDSQHVAWLDSAGNVWITPTTASTMPTSLYTEAGAGTGEFSTASNRIAWLDGKTGSMRMVELDAGVVGPVQAVEPTSTGLNQVVISGADIFWTDGVQVFSKPL